MKIIRFFQFVKVSSFCKMSCAADLQKLDFMNYLFMIFVKEKKTINIHKYIFHKYIPYCIKLYKNLQRLHFYELLETRFLKYILDSL